MREPAWDVADQFDSVGRKMGGLGHHDAGQDDDQGSRDSAEQLAKTRSTPSEPPPTSTVQPLVSPSSRMMCQSWAKKSPEPFDTPRSLGTWPIMMVMARPMMKPLSTGSEMKLATNPRRANPATRARTPVVMARVAVRAA